MIKMCDFKRCVNTMYIFRWRLVIYERVHFHRCNKHLGCFVLFYFDACILFDLK